jgi:hypothetical protein
MKKIAAATVALATLAGLSSAAVSSSTAAPERQMHTKRYVLHEIASHQLGQYSFAGSDRITSRRSGEVVGYDSFTAVFDPQTEMGRFWVGAALKGGVINIRVRVTDPESDQFAGKITGGTGRYMGIEGTVTGRGVSGNRTYVTLRYTL